jgi:hypothetical protein
LHALDCQGLDLPNKAVNLERLLLATPPSDADRRAVPTKTIEAQGKAMAESRSRCFSVKKQGLPSAESHRLSEGLNAPSRVPVGSIAEDRLKADIYVSSKE